MARRRPPVVAGVREELAARDREFVACNADIYGSTDPGGYLRRAEALDRGETVEVSGWELPAGAVSRGGASFRYRVHPDGSIERMTP